MVLCSVEPSRSMMLPLSADGPFSSGSLTTPLLKADGTDPVLIGSDLDFQNTHNLLRCPSINGIRPSGGVYSESTATEFVGAQTETAVLMQGTSYGTLSVSANTFQPGDCYAIKVGGDITCDNNDVFTLRIRSNFGAGTSPIFAEIEVAVDGAQVAGWWEVEVEFIVRETGASGVASMSTNGHYSYFNGTNVSKGYGVNTIQNTNFDTTIANELMLTYATGEASITAFRVSQVALTKLFYYINFFHSI